MAQWPSIKKPWRIRIPGGLYHRLRNHLFPGDGDEHGAVILAGCAETERDIRLLAREAHLAQDGYDYRVGMRSHRQLGAEFINSNVLKARDEKLVYLAVHNHPGADQVSFSATDRRSHEHGYPALLQITQGIPVGALVFAEGAIAGEIWLSPNSRVPLADSTIIGHGRQTLTPSPIRQSTQADSRYDRQTLLFGNKGQDILGKAKVAIIGLGGVGSLLAEYLGRLGVGRFVLVDPDRVEHSNLPRLIGSRRTDAGPRLLSRSQSKYLRALRRQLSRRKVDIAKRNIKRANPYAEVQTLATDLVEPHVPFHLVDCDYLFLAADSMRARQVFNAIVHQYLIPGVQIGAKVISGEYGQINAVYAVTRPVAPENGCLWCSKFIDSTKLQEETMPEKERGQWRYVDDLEVAAPSVITLNALASAQAANDFMFYMTGLMKEEASSDYMYFNPQIREVRWDQPAQNRSCIDCGLSDRSRFARGDGRHLPIEVRQK